MNLHYRLASPEDIPAMSALLAELFAIERDFDADAGRQALGLARMLEAPSRGRAVVAVDGEKVVGMVTGQLLVSTAEGGTSALVEDLVVAESHRGRGVGAGLLAEIERWAAATGTRRMQLLADRDNHRALGFYERSGWNPTNLINYRKFASEGPSASGPLERQG